MQELAYRQRSEENDKRARRKFFWALQTMAAGLLVAAPFVPFQIGVGFLSIAAMICAGTLFNARERDDDAKALLRLINRFMPLLPSLREWQAPRKEDEEEKS